MRVTKPRTSPGRARPGAVVAAIAVAALALVAGPRAHIATSQAQIEDDLRECDRYFDEANWRKAAAACDAAIRKLPAQVPAEAYGKRAAIFIILKDYKGGLEFVRTVAKPQHPEAPDILEQEALMLWATGDKPGAIQVAERVVSRKPAAFSNQALIGEFYANRDPGKTVTAYAAYLQYRPDDLKRNDVLPRIRLGFAYLARARTALRDGKPADTRADYQQAIEQFETVSREFSKARYAQPNADNGLCAGYTGLGKFDRAIAVCERISRDTKNVDANGSAFFNLGVAYLAKKLPQRARKAAQDYLKLRKNEARGHILVGDAYFQEKDWAQALDAYLKAEKLLRPGQQREQASLSIALGKTYRRLPYTGSGQNPNLALAIAKLQKGREAAPDRLDLAVEMGSAQLAATQDSEALTTASSAMANKSFAGASDEDKADLYLVAAKAQYNLGKLPAARQQFEAASQLRPKDVQVRRGLIGTINAQAWAALQKNDARAAQGFLDEAAKADPSSPMTALNMAILAVERGDCAAAQRHLDRVKGNRRGYALVYERMMGRTYLCLKKPDRAKAATHFAAADEEARKLQANLLAAEVYTEWAPLLIETNLDDAVDKLQVAVQFSTQSAEVGPAAKRNLAVALFRRGWRSLKAGKAAEAATDFERASREPALLKGSEPGAFQFSYALALLDKGDTAEASRLFKALASKGNQSTYLKAPYNKIGPQFFGAYAEYRSGNAASRQKAAGQFASMLGSASGSFAQKVRDLIGSSWELVAYDHWRSGRTGPADKALGNALRYANEDTKRRITNDRAALKLGRDDLSTLEGLGGNPPESLVNLGIVYDQMGRPKDAYDAWQRARAKGVSSKDLQKWIDAKKRIYGY